MLSEPHFEAIFWKSAKPCFSKKWGTKVCAKIYVAV